jgi:hypothetical protein
MKYTLILVLLAFFIQGCHGPISIKPMHEYRSKTQLLYDYYTGESVAQFIINQEYDAHDYYDTRTSLTVKNVSPYTVTFNFRVYIDGPGYNRIYTNSVVRLPVGRSINFGTISNDSYNLDSCTVFVNSPSDIEYNLSPSNG